MICDERTINRMRVRLAMFIRRDMTELGAERLVDRLAFRDFERDDRRVCIECAHLQRDGACFAARQGWLQSTTRRHSPVVDLLQRCESFSWQAA